MIGYNPWSFTDLLSTGNGMAKRYGLVYINTTDEETLDLRRIPKDSFYWYSRLIRSNGRDWGRPTVDEFVCGGLQIAMAHSRRSLDCVRADLKIFGHSHQLCDEQLGTVRWLNPGSCGRKRFNLELTMMILTIKDQKLQVERIDLSR